MKMIQKMILMTGVALLALASMNMSGCEKDEVIETVKILSLDISLRTGGDDLRQGSEALGTIGFKMAPTRASASTTAPIGATILPIPPA
jgi:hypothetical protein